jgi:hypothetical protein
VASHATVVATRNRCGEPTGPGGGDLRTVGGATGTTDTQGDP